MKNEVIDKLSTLITTAFGLVAALAWNEAVQAIFKQAFGEAQGIPAMVGYAVSTTIIAVVAAIWIGRVAGKAKGEA